MPQFLHLWNETNNNTCLVRLLWGLKEYVSNVWSNGWHVLKYSCWLLLLLIFFQWRNPEHKYSALQVLVCPITWCQVLPYLHLVIKLDSLTIRQCPPPSPHHPPPHLSWYYPSAFCVGGGGSDLAMGAAKRHQRNIVSSFNELNSYLGKWAKRKEIFSTMLALSQWAQPKPPGSKHRQAHAQNIFLTQR